MKLMEKFRKSLMEEKLLFLGIEKKYWISFLTYRLLEDFGNEN